MSGIQVIVQRDSVCAGDDVTAPNEIRFWLSDEAKIKEIFSELTAKDYLPTIAGFNESWRAEVCGNAVCTFNKNIGKPDYIIDSDNQISSFKNFDGTASVFLTYYSAPD